MPRCRPVPERRHLANEASGRTLAARGARTAPRFGLRRIRWPFACVADQALRRLGAPAARSRQDVSNLIAIVGKEGR